MNADKGRSVKMNRYDRSHGESRGGRRRRLPILALVAAAALSIQCEAKLAEFFGLIDGGGPTDMTPPVISFLAPSGTVHNDDKVCINVTDEGGSGLNQVTAGNVVSLPVTPGGTDGVFNIGISAAAQGAHTVRVNASDNAGNESTASTNIVKDTEAPTIGNFTVPANQTSSALSLSLSVGYRITDANPWNTSRFSLFFAGTDNQCGTADDTAVPGGTSGGQANPSTQDVTGTGTGTTRDFTANWTSFNGVTTPGASAVRRFCPRVEAFDTGKSCTGQDNPNTTTTFGPGFDITWQGPPGGGFAIDLTNRGWNHTMPGIESVECKLIITTPAQPGASYSVTTTGPTEGGPSGVIAGQTIAGILNSLGQAPFSVRINRFGTYVNVVIVISTGGVSRSATANVTVLSSSNTCPTTAPSSARFKRGVTALLPDGATILGLRPVAFRYRAPYGDPSVRQVGLIAEEVFLAYPEAVALDADGRPEGIDYGALTGLVIQEIGTRISRAVEAGIEQVTGTP